MGNTLKHSPWRKQIIYSTMAHASFEKQSGQLACDMKYYGLSESTHSFPQLGQLSWADVDTGTRVR